MNPFFFGTSQRRLFGIYTPPARAAAGARAVVLCHPWGQEYLGAHRSMRHLASMLAGAGLHVLRFDYFGTGDSAGEMRQADLEGWSSDIETAVEELRDMSEAPRVGLAGLRLGATLAATVAARRPEEIDALALWNPIASGEEYLRELVGTELAMRGEVKQTPLAADGTEREIGGFPLTPHMAQALRGLDLAALAPRIEARTLMVSCTEGDSHFALRDSLATRLRGPLEVDQIIADAPWVEGLAFRTGAVPIKVLQRIVEWLR